MLPPRIPPDEQLRLEMLEEYAVLDTEAEPQFDAIGKLAATILDVPIALISIVDGSRQWFKARYGLDVTQTSREISFCGHVVADRNGLLVEDTALDARFVDNPLVVSTPNIRFYAGMPLTTPEGFVLGTLCAIDTKPRQLSPAQLETLRALADQVLALLELRRIGRQLLLERERSADRERRLATLFDGMDEGVVLQNRSGSIIEHNRAALDILGVSSDRVAGSSPHDPRWRTIREDGLPFPGDDHPGMLTLRTGAPCTGVVMGVYRPDGGLRWISINSRPIMEPGESLPYQVITTFRDITDQRALDQRIARHERLVTIGTLAAGVGHEINNPLAYLTTNLDLAIEELNAIGGGSPSRRTLDIVEMLQQSREGAHRVKRIVRGLRSLTRDDAEISATEVNSVIRSALELASYDVRSRASVVLDLGPLPPAAADEARLTQVIVNLLVNAAQAFPGTALENQIRIATSASSTTIKIEISDNGPGIPPEVLSRIFDPFFTTKPPGVGTGLGLSISQSIVMALGGELTCETRLGHGTTFSVTLPISHPPADEPEPASSVRCRVLAVDDERAILQSITRLLRREAEVTTVEDPRDALRRLEAGEVFDVVFCDILMVHLTGIELYERVATFSPDMAARFVFITGDMTRSDISQFLAKVPNERLEKPFNMQDLRGIALRFSQRR